MITHARLGWRLELALGAPGAVWNVDNWNESYWSDTDVEWVDVTDTVLEVLQTDHGRQTFDELVLAGTCDILVDNANGQYNPDDGPGDLPGDLTIAPGRWLRLCTVTDSGDTVAVTTGDTWEASAVPGQTWTVTGAGTTIIDDYRLAHNVLTGRLDIIQEQYLMGGSDSVAVLTASDFAALLASDEEPQRPAPIGVGDLTSERVTRILDRAGWPEAWRDIQDGTYTMIGTDLDSNRLTLIQQAAQAELGAFLFDGVTATFKASGWLETDTRSTTIQAYIGRGDPGDPRPVAATTIRSGRLVRNDVQLSTSDGLKVRIIDAASKSFNGPRKWSQSGYQNDTEADLEAIAGAIIDAYAGDPAAYQRLRTVTVTADNGDYVAANTIASLELGDLVQVDLPLTLLGWSIQTWAHVSGVNWSARGRDWTCILRLDESRAGVPT